MMFFERYIDSIIGIITTILSIVKGSFLIEKMGPDKYLMLIIVLVIVTLVMLSDSEKMENR